jgi:hypothetical protein
MTGTTNQIQTPFGSGVTTALGLAAGAAGGISEIPANPNITVTGSPYGTLFSVWQGANIAGGSYTTPLTFGQYNNVAPNGGGDGLPAVTALNLGGIQVLNNMLTGTLLITSLVANSLIQISSDFNLTAASLTTLTMPSLAYIGGVMNCVFNTLPTFSLPALIAVNANWGATSTGTTTLSMPLLSYIGGALAPNFSAVTSVDFSGLQYVGVNIAFTAATLATLNFPALVKVGTTIAATAANLVTFSMGSTLKAVGGNFTITGAKLNQASVDGILVSLAALDGTNGTTAYSGFTVNVSGGTSSAPSATGLAAKTTLQGRGCTVTTN